MIGMRMTRRIGIPTIVANGITLARRGEFSAAAARRCDRVRGCAGSEIA